MKRFVLIFVVTALVIATAVCAFILNNCPNSKAAAQIRAQWDQTYAYGVKGYDYAKDGVTKAWTWCKSKMPKKSETKAEPAPAEPVKEEPTPETTAEENVGVESEEAPEETVTKAYPFSFSKSNWYGGRGLVTSDVKGKTVMVYLWNREVQESVDVLPRIEQVWNAYQHLPIMIIGSHRCGEPTDGKIKEVAKIVKAKKLSFPNFEGAGLKCEPRGVSKYPYIYVVNPQGKIVYRGHSDREATGALVNAIDFSSKLK